MRKLLLGAGLWCVALGLASSGCTPKATTPGEQSAENGGAAADAAAPGKSDQVLRARPDVKQIPGGWALVLTQQATDAKGQPAFRDLCVALLRIGAGGEAEVLATPPNAPVLKAETATIDGNQLSLDFTVEPRRWEFRGALQEGMIRGTLKLPQVGVVPAQLLPSDRSSFEGWDPAPIAAGFATFMAAMQQKEQPAATLAAAQELRGSALALEAYQMVLSRVGSFPLEEAGARKLVDQFCAEAKLWGPRMEARAWMTSSVNVAFSRMFPALARELLDVAEQKLGDQKDDWQEALAAAREQCRVDQALLDLKSADAALQTAAYATLQEVLPAQRYNAELLDALALHAEKIGQHDLARDYLADIVALPLLEQLWGSMRQGQPPGDPTPRERLATMWEKQHGDTAGLDDFLKATYERRLGELFEKIRSAAGEPVLPEDGNRTILLELFTGVTCNPCVAADLALSAVRAAYPPAKVIVLQYHQHIPGPDPLANQDAEDRMGFYESNGTPTVCIDGGVIPGVGGFLQHVEQKFRGLRQILDQRLKDRSDVTLTASASLTDGKLVVQAAAENLTDEQRGSARLRLAVVEDQIDYDAPNGIRRHEFVVREMLGGAKGVGVKSGKLAYSVEMPLDEIKQHLTEYLQQFETGRGMTFPAKPLQLQPLSLVVWVQNDATREVLQATVVPVAGTQAAGAEEPPPSAEQPANAAPQ